MSLLLSQLGGAGNFEITATSSAIVLSSASVILAVGRQLTATTSNIALAASSVGLAHGYNLSAISSAITLVGSSVTLAAGRQIAATSSAITLAASSANLAVGRNISAVSSAIALSGSEVTLTYTPSTVAYEIEAVSSEIVLSGSSVELIYTSAVIIDQMDMHDGKPSDPSKWEETQQAKIVRQQRDIENTLAKYFRGDEPETEIETTQAAPPRKPLPIALTRLLESPAAKPDLSGYEFDDDFAAKLAEYRAAQNELKRLENDELAMVFLLCM